MNVWTNSKTKTTCRLLLDMEYGICSCIVVLEVWSTIALPADKCRTPDLRSLVVFVAHNLGQSSKTDRRRVRMCVWDGNRTEQNALITMKWIWKKQKKKPASQPARMVETVLLARPPFYRSFVEREEIHRYWRRSHTHRMYVTRYIFDVRRSLTEHPKRRPSSVIIMLFSLLF